jgi:hypothetical protein
MMLVVSGKMSRHGVNVAVDVDANVNVNVSERVDCWLF